LVLHFLCFWIDSNFHMPEGQGRTSWKEAVFEDLVEMRCTEDFRSFVIEIEKMLENPACETSTV